MLVQNAYSLLKNLASDCHLADTVMESSKGHFTVLSSQRLQESGEHGKASGFYEHGPMTALPLLCGEFVGQKQCRAGHHDSGRGIP